MIPILGDVIEAVKDLASEAIVDKDKRDEVLYKLQELEDRENERIHEEALGQIEVNKVEAASDSVFVAGWRPFIGWAGGAALLYNVLLAPAFKLVVADLAFLQTVLMGILGMGAMRTFERVKQVNTPGPAPIKQIVKAVKNKLPENAAWIK